MATKKKMLMSAAGNAGGAGLDVESVFSTYLYDGTSAEHTITNGIDLAGEGGMIWGKIRSSTDQHWIVDSERGTGSNSNYKYLMPNLTNGESDFASRSVSSFNSDGFTLQNGTDKQFNESGQDYASWTFRKAPKFFTCLTYTGDGDFTGRTISHNLGSVPGMILIKKTSGAADWIVYHRSEGATKYLELNNTNESNTYNMFNDTDPTATEFSVSSYSKVNNNGDTYVAYLFAHNNNDGGFGADGDLDIIKCGSYTGNGSTNGPEIDLGFEPQWVMIKRSDSVAGWVIFDNMRGMVVGGNDPLLQPNNSDAENTGLNAIAPQSTGFQIESAAGTYNASGGTYIYIAIRRGTKVPESATEVFAIDASPNSSFPVYEAGFPVDLGIKRYDYPSSGNSNFACDRLRGSQRLFTNLTNAESSSTDVAFDSQVGWWTQPENSTSISWMWKRAPGYFDAVAYTGTGSATTVSHNLGVAPEMMWVKSRTEVKNWIVYHKDLTDNTKYLELNDTDAEKTATTAWNSTSPTETVFTVGTATSVNNSSQDYIAYLFASLPGISKVGSYTGNGTSQTIDCGFTSGARFVLIKETSGTSPWHVFDTERGIVAGNDPRLKLDNTDAQTTTQDFIDPAPSGFAVTSSSITNGSGDEYIFYAIA
jgi:hypothetical protein